MVLVRVTFSIMLVFSGLGSKMGLPLGIELGVPPIEQQYLALKKKRRRPPDKDKDFLADRKELKKFGTDPTSKDTDGDGVPDGDEDHDSDGITNEDEDDKVGEGSTREDRDDPPGSNPTPTPTSRPTPTPTPRPTPTPTAGGFFETDGDVTTEGKIKFGIPSNLSANFNRGFSVWGARCRECHATEKLGKNYTYIVNAVRVAPMFITNMTPQELADLTAYLNRFQKP